MSILRHFCLILKFVSSVDHLKTIKINVPPYPRLLALTLTHQICCWSPSVKQPPSITDVSPYFSFLWKKESH